MRVNRQLVFFCFSIGFLLTLFFTFFSLLFYFFHDSFLFWLIFFGIHYLICAVFVVASCYTNWHLMYRITAITLVVLFPYLGFCGFIVIGRRYRLKLKLKRWKRRHKDFQKLIQQYQPTQQFSPIIPQSVQQFRQFSEKFSLFAFTNNNQIRFFTEPITKTQQLQRDLKNAQHYIYFNIYLFSEGQYLSLLEHLLIQKARQGLEIRIIYDAFGTFWHSSMSFVMHLKRNGVIMKSFGTQNPLFASILERNHRKDIIIDGKIAYTGGSNIGDEYLSLDKAYGYLCDFDVRLEGNIVRDLEMIFWKDWMICTGENILKQTSQKVVKQLLKPVNVVGNTWVQTINDGPNIEELLNRDIFFNIFSKAKKRIWLATPYFFIDPEINRALINAALNGIDVRLVVHNFPALKFLVNLTRLSYDELLEAGVKIYEFAYSYMHAKLIIVDDEFISIGNGNLDYTSFYYCYQTNLLLFDSKINLQMRKTFFQALFYNSFKIKKNPLNKASALYRGFLKFMALFATFL